MITVYWDFVPYLIILHIFFHIYLAQLSKKVHRETLNHILSSNNTLTGERRDYLTSVTLVYQVLSEGPIKFLHVGSLIVPFPSLTFFLSSNNGTIWLEFIHLVLSEFLYHLSWPEGHLKVVYVALELWQSASASMKILRFLMENKQTKMPLQGMHPYCLERLMHWPVQIVRAGMENKNWGRTGLDPLEAQWMIPEWITETIIT